MATAQIIKLNAVQFIIYVLAQQPQGQLETQHSNIRRIHKYKQQMKTHRKEARKDHVLNSNSINNVMIVKKIREIVLLSKTESTSPFNSIYERTGQLQCN
jgi:hypothetical protein